MDFTSFSTPKPSVYADKIPVTSTGTQALTTSFLQAAALVTPDYPQREFVCNNSSASNNGIPDRRQLTLTLTDKALRMTNLSMSAPRIQPSLVPRPVKTGTTSPGLPPPLPLMKKKPKPSSKTDGAAASSSGSGSRLNKFVRRLHDMLQAEKDSGVVEWRRGLLVLFSTDAFAKKILPKYFNTRNFKTFRRQLNYYGFVHVRSFSTTGSSTTALWVNRELAKEGDENISSVLRLRRVEPCETAKTAEGRRHRKEMAISTVEDDIGVNAKTLQMEQIRFMALRGDDDLLGQVNLSTLKSLAPPIPTEVHIPTDSSEANCAGSACVDEDSSDDSSTSGSDDNASQCAANVLLMLSRS